MMLAEFIELNADTSSFLRVRVGDYSEEIRVHEIMGFWSNVSFRGEVRAREELRGLAARLNQFGSQLTQWRNAQQGVDSEFDANGEAERFSRRHVRLTKAYWSAIGRTASAMIVGPARFPTARNRKRQGWAENAARAIDYHAAAALKAAKRRAFPYGAPGEAIRSGDPDAIEKLRVKLADLRAEHEREKHINSLWRKAGKPGQTDQAGWESIAKQLGCDVSAFEELRGMLGRMGYVPQSLYYLANNTANMKRIEDRIAGLERMKARGDSETDSGLGFTVKENAEAARIQLVFPGKPADKVRAVLKANGFRWAPSEGAWQRHLNNAGRYALQCVKRELGGS